MDFYRINGACGCVGAGLLWPPGDQQSLNDMIGRGLRAWLRTARCPDRSLPLAARRADTRKVRPYELDGRALIARPLATRRWTQERSAEPTSRPAQVMLGERQRADPLACYFEDRLRDRGGDLRDG